MRREGDTKDSENEKFGDSSEVMRDLVLNGVQLNTTKTITFEISNFNSIEVSIQLF